VVNQVDHQQEETYRRNQRQRQLEEAADWSGAVDGSADKLQLPVFLRRAAVDPAFAG
jgi:hypothetical protein